MARTGKYQNENAAAAKLWRVGVYIRLSREDGDRAESESIQNQRAFLQEFLSRQADCQRVDEYVDDGYSGTDFKRPGFSRMLADLYAGRIDCVAVKDLSRFGRNYIEAGKYIETVFPTLGVRFISVADAVDSFTDPQSTDSILMPFKNLINDEYCRDISKKVRATLDVKRQKGQFIGSFAPFGYQKDPLDHNHLVVDEEAAQTVREIYRLFLSGCSIIGIARTLNERGLFNPTAYKRRCGMAYAHPADGAGPSLWADRTVRRILTNEAYLGCVVQGKNRTVSYKVHLAREVPVENWVRVPGMHEPIITEETFRRVQALLTRDTRTPKDERRVHLLSGYVRCADCQRAMNRRVNRHSYGDYAYYVCSTYKKQHTGCTRHGVRADKVEAAVLATIRAHVRLAVDFEALAEAASGDSLLQKRREAVQNRLKQLGRELERQRLLREDLYPDWKSGMLDREEYLSLKARFESAMAAIAREMEQAEAERTALEQPEAAQNAFVQNFSKYEGASVLTREMVTELIENVYIHEHDEITIVLRYRDAFEEAKLALQGQNPGA